MLRILAPLLLAGLLAACRAQPIAPTLTAAPGDTLRLEVGQSFLVPLPMHSGTGHQWGIDSVPLDLVRFDSIAYDPAEPTPELPAVGERMQRFRFSAVAPGRAELRFLLRRPFGPRVALDSAAVIVEIRR